MSPFGGLVSRSPAIRLVEEEAEYAARSDAKILLTGESGVGKEVVARVVHRESARRAAPFITINCAGVPDTLLESELFGHERGSFTGAYRDKPGLLEVGDRGTVFLDEVGEMSVRMQGMLLRFLETGELQRVGASGAQRRVDVRIIAATNRDLMERIREAAFREDLYYRLNVIHLSIPALRERLEDVLPLMEHFLEHFATRSGIGVPQLTDEARETLLAYRWPGNVRELRNLAERLVVRGKPLVGSHDFDLFVALKPAAARATIASPALAESLFTRMTRQGESFWIAAYPAFMARDITRDDLRTIVKMGLEETRGNHKMLVRLFNMDPADYKRFLNFLRKYHCHMPFQAYRNALPESREPAAAATGTDHRWY